MLLARWLVSHVPLRYWRKALGHRTAAEPGDATLRLAENLAARRLARAVGRAVRRLPGETRCLPQAIALHWLLRVRRSSGTLVIGVLQRQSRGQLGDLHAWLVRHGEVLLGASDEDFRPLLGVTFKPI